MIRVLPFARAKLNQFDCYDVDLNHGDGYQTINRMEERADINPESKRDMQLLQRRRSRQTRAFCDDPTVARFIEAMRTAPR